MKKLTAYYFLLFWCAAVCKPLTIWLANGMAHAWFNQQHIEIVHEHQGENHVHTELGKAGNHDVPQPKNSTIKTEDITLFSKTFDCTLGVNDHVVIPINDAYCSTRLPLISLVVPLPPPWQS